MQLLITHLRQ
jgi:hypothetical protein